MENDKGITTSQMKKLRLWSKDLAILLDQRDFENISKIFTNVVEGELYYQEYGESEDK